MFEICWTDGGLGQGCEKDVVGDIHASRTIVPSKVYRAYIFPVHWVDGSNLRAISRVRRTAVCFRKILNYTCDGDLSEVYTFIYLCDCHRVNWIWREINFQRNTTNLTNRPLHVVAACWGREVKAGGFRQEQEIETRGSKNRRMILLSRDDS